MILHYLVYLWLSVETRSIDGNKRGNENVKRTCYLCTADQGPFYWTLRSRGRKGCKGGEKGRRKKDEGSKRV